MQQTLTYPARPRRSGLVPGLAISILLHVLLLALWRAPSSPSAPPDERRWAQPLTIRIVPPRPPEPVVRAEPPAPRAKPDKPADSPAPVRAPSKSIERTARTEHAEPDSAPPPEMAVVPAEPAEPAALESAPKFDPDAARAAARAMAKDLDTPSQNWVAEKLKKERELQETRDAQLGRNIAGAARPDCKTAYAGAGLLAPLLMLMDKKDSGCKW